MPKTLSNTSGRPFKLHACKYGVPQVDTLVIQAHAGSWTGLQPAKGIASFWMAILACSW